MTQQDAVRTVVRFAKEDVFGFDMDGVAIVPASELTLQRALEVLGMSVRVFTLEEEDDNES